MLRITLTIDAMIVVDYGIDVVASIDLIPVVLAFNSDLVVRAPSFDVALTIFVSRKICSAPNFNVHTPGLPNIHTPEFARSSKARYH